MAEWLWKAAEWLYSVRWIWWVWWGIVALQVMMFLDPDCCRPGYEWGGPGGPGGPTRAQ